MSNRPELLDRQWWLLNALASGKRANLRTLIQHSRAPAEELFVDMRCMRDEGLLSAAIFRPEDGHVYPKPTQRGREWARKWRKEQAEQASDELIHLENE